VIRAFISVAAATVVMIGLALFFVGFVLAPLIILALGYALFAFTSR
jgi:hypothetical protein